MVNGFNVSNSTEAIEALVPTRYARRLAERRETEEIRQLSNFGLTVGCVFTLLGGFIWFCVVSRMDWFWWGMMVVGMVLLFLGTVLPQSLHWPNKLWMGLAHLQGQLMMSILLTLVYFGLIWPLGLWERVKRGGTHPFHSWDVAVPPLKSACEALPESSMRGSVDSPLATKSRSVFGLFAETLKFFAQRGHYMMLPILLVLLLLGLILFFVQTSALAPFIYTVA